MIPVAQLPALVRSITDAIQKQGNPEVERLEITFLEDFSKTRRRRYFMPRITSATLAAISGVLFAFPGSVANHPFALAFFSFWGKEPRQIDPGVYEIPRESLQLFTLIFALAFFFFGAYFLLTWLREQREAVAAEYLVSEEGLRDAFSYLCSLSFFDNIPQGKLTFSVRDVVVSLQDRNSPAQGLLADPKLAGTVSRVLIDKLIERGVIAKINKPDLDEWYEVDREIVYRHRRPIQESVQAPSSKVFWQRLLSLLG
jgi:hypothetical protein